MFFINSFKYLSFSFILLNVLLLSACSEEPAPTDLETNKYYADYIAIYEAYDSLGNEATLKALNSYIEQYPERNDAYVFKAYILGKMGDYASANAIYEEVKAKDSLNISIYEYQSAFLLFDTSQQVKTLEIIEKGLSIEDSSSALYNNFAWLHIFQKNYSEAINIAEQGIAVDSNNLYLYRTVYVATFLANEKTLQEKYAEILLEKKLEDPLVLNEKIKNLGPYKLLESIK